MNILRNNMQMQNLSPQLMQSIQQVKQMRNMCNGDINGLIQQMVNANPQLSQVLQMTKNQSAETIVRNLCQQKGIDVNALMNALK